jgi:hypothetical protein
MLRPLFISLVSFVRSDHQNTVAAEPLCERVTTTRPWLQLDSNGKISKLVSLKQRPLPQLRQLVV